MFIIWILCLYFLGNKGLIGLLINCVVNVVLLLGCFFFFLNLLGILFVVYIFFL